MRGRKTRGLWKNGSRWWLRIRTPGGTVVPRSTGTDDAKLAANVLTMIEAMREQKQYWDILDLLASGTYQLLSTYSLWASGRIDELRVAHAASIAEEAEPNIEPWVKRWADEHLALLVENRKITQRTADDYLKHVRVLVPEGLKFPRSQFTEDYIIGKLREMSASSSTKRRYVSSWRVFARYARKRVPLVENPFQDAGDWLPQNSDARSMHWDHETRTKIISMIDSEELRIALTLMMGSGIELGALLAMQGRHVNKDRTIIAPGTKNAHRRDRTIFVDQWAFPAVAEWSRYVLPTAPLFPNIDADGGNLRDAFYGAQVKAGLIEKPQRSPRTRHLIWSGKNTHTLHDCRHTYAYNRLLGLDGEPRQSLKFVSLQLGHANEQMVMRVYAKLNIEERARQIGVSARAAEAAAV